ncbi:MAG TPA: FAD-binding oxidoreductase [Streptosporangiaceae bacterium]|jgi:decaprenylphospho-beta-D-ribofuranose 2-oxidase
MSVLMSENGRLLTGWGRTGASRAMVAGPLDTGRLQALVASRPPGGVLARGSGLSYGDAAQNAGGYVLSPVTLPSVELAADGERVRASASATFADVLAAIVPHGRILPALPGTSGVTVGGAIAADVHGKNQRADGSLSAWLEEIELIDGTGALRRLTPDCDPSGFRATVGGMGLTGIVIAATIRLLPVLSARIRVTARRLPDLDALLGALDGSRSRYTVAWVDTTASGASLGRGVLDEGDHLTGTDPELGQETLAYSPGPGHRAPSLGFCPVTHASARAFNSLWFRKAPRSKTSLTGLPAFFHRLDAIAGWNRALGPRGFVQYQFAVPDGAEQVVAGVLAAVQRERCAPFLGTLKRFGPASRGHLSFAMPGWSLAIDMPAGNPRVAPLLNRLDGQVAEAGGRVYLAKDGRLPGAALAAMYPELPGWQAVRARFDPAGVFRSDLGRRVGLC